MQRFPTLLTRQIPRNEPSFPWLTSLRQACRSAPMPSFHQFDSPGSEKAVAAVTRGTRQDAQLIEVHQANAAGCPAKWPAEIRGQKVHPLLDDMPAPGRSPSPEGLRFPIISRGVRKLVDRAGFGMGDDPCSRDDGPCNGEGICPHPRPLSRRERGEKVQVITGKSAPLPAGEGLRGEGHPSPPWHWLIAF
jgi:hypothetical protein